MFGIANINDSKDNKYKGKDNIDMKNNNNIKQHTFNYNYNSNS